MVPINTDNFLRNTKSDLFWRKYGLFLYWIACFTIIISVPEGFHTHIKSLISLAKSPLIESTLDIAKNKEIVSAWALATFIVYPLFHFSMRSRIYANAPQGGQLVKGILAVLILDAVLLATLSIDIQSLSLRGITRAWRRVIFSSDIGLAVIAPLISMIYSLAFFMTLHVIKISFSKLTKEKH